jgi:hypothetical protein
MVRPYLPPEWTYNVDLETIEYFQEPRQGIIAKGNCYAENVTKPAEKKPSRRCEGTEVNFPIKIDWKDHHLFVNCGVKLGKGAFGSFWSLVDENLKETEFGIKIFFRKTPDIPKKELDEINFFRQYFESIPEVVKDSIQIKTEYMKENSNYIIKKRIDGSRLYDLYEFGCFLEAKQLNDKKDIDKCKDLTGNSTGEKLLVGLNKLLEELKRFDDQGTGFIIEDLAGENILWDKKEKKMVIVDFMKGVFFKGDPNSLGWFGKSLEEGMIFKGYPKNSHLSKSEDCLEKQKIQDLFSKYIHIPENSDCSRE